MVTSLPTPGSGDVWGTTLNTVVRERTGPPPLLTPATPLDDFGGSALPAGWSAQGYASGDYAVSHSWLSVTAPKAPNNYFYKAVPAGDFTATMRAAFSAGGANMFGFVVVDGSGNGVGAGWYNSSPDLTLIAPITAGVYSTGASAGNRPPGSEMGNGKPGWYRLRRVGTTYYASCSSTGLAWGPEQSMSYATAVTRLGFGQWFGTTALSWAVDYFDVV